MLIKHFIYVTALFGSTTAKLHFAESHKAKLIFTEKKVSYLRQDSPPRHLKQRSTQDQERSNFQNATSRETTEAQIIGGTTAEVDEFPYFASVFDSSHQGLCGAALIAPDFLISAAHCAEAFTEDVIVGAMHRDQVTPGSQQVSVVKQVIHPNFEDFSQNDVMLIQISPAITSIAPVEVNFDIELPVMNESLTVIGFGRTSSNGPDSNTLQKAQVSEVPATQCQTYFRAEISPSKHICVWNEEPFRSTCLGDSGGPLLGAGSDPTSNTMLTFGVTSFGPTGCTGPAVYTRLSGYKDFIEQTVCGYSANPPAYLDCGSVDNTDTTTASDMETNTASDTDTSTASDTSSCASSQRAYTHCLDNQLVTRQARSCMSCMNGVLDDTFRSCVQFENMVCGAARKCDCAECANEIAAYVLCAGGCANAVCPDVLSTTDLP